MKPETIFVVGSILNGIIFPVLLFYMRKITSITGTVIKMEGKFETSLGLLDSLVTKVEVLLKDNTINKEQLSFLHKEIAELKQATHKNSGQIMRQDLGLTKLEMDIEHLKELQSCKQVKH